MVGTPFEKGKSGNPTGRPKIPAEVRELARGATVKALSRAIELIDSADENVALKAVNTVLDRALGKPTQPVDGDGEGGPIRSLVQVRFVKPGER
ncbi:DUF5681 domain-containing protein [Methylorubrum extorquens]|uniref:DUF5681 domain-containing protein n=1 Tax=Methylorubrum extorquens (strain ATCC 14718 / DSM 1338 / JCM 2805 / NCIMB 9133 / AM1) TaxID=272630 RepID=C5B0S8_METEA|nr:DUF5681 domain-containing protein [Methylorubrum extorquens]ACS41665.1 Hypothetical protein MexAM1_META1p3985 [Methylorubrum extorquens AM1]MCP1545321.1 hypothetical protein [Methylorubrum extorquens]MCP1587332.1 hypothetical protein [Methylorubrum extorquens]